MKDPELRVAEEELREAQKKAQAVRLKNWETHGPEWWRRLGVFLASVVLGYAVALGVFLLLHGVPWQRLLSPAFVVSIPLLLRFLPPTSHRARYFDWELGFGLFTGVVLTVLLVPPQY